MITIYGKRVTVSRDVIVWVAYILNGQRKVWATQQSNNAFNRSTSY